MSASNPSGQDVDLDALMEEETETYGGDRLQEDNAAILEELERKKRARKLANVPTDDRKVRAKLREMGEPITLFGEGAADRYARLRYVMSQIQVAKEGLEGMDGQESDGDSSSSDGEESDEEFYTEPSLPDQLLAARKKIAAYSLPISARRLKKQRVESALPIGRILEVRKKTYKDLKTMQLLGSQIGDTRPISLTRFSPNSKLIATASWTGTAKVFDVPNLNEKSVFKGHDTHCRGLAWHPKATLSLGSESVNLATGGGEGTVKLWSLDSPTPLRTLEGHAAPVARVAFHPSGDYLASASFDGSWRLWDTETGEELLLQEGHSKEVYAVGWQDDGGLVATGGLDGIGRVWDARTGRTVWVLDGHVRQITALDWSPNGYQLATGSADDSIKIWDIRKLGCTYTIPAHRSLVSDLKFFRSISERHSLLSLPTTEPTPTSTSIKTESSEANMDVSMDGEPTNGSSSNLDSSTHSSANTLTPHINRSGLYLTSAGYDSTIKIWSSDDWQLVKSITTDSGKVMSVDVDGEGTFMVSGSANRNFQLYGGEGSL
ncbi:U4/U6 small nuclear ribonucleoprotein Prp4 (contains WD40 repeats) [Phaffia rhodozyma]|uniref:U4/U6 small nuclear ribonucleoprotein Prp4 (Contains WD40 repeats) n=1 Tax=Phaffia rhodozyma TaxID=264483 RepID=A0A0F7SVI7_PHARH|nr:U4/U6 small nuclear ribonucleoprotein Prp4 (contains WD40 repeats) [Phaffia rhodozyma]